VKQPPLKFLHPEESLSRAKLTQLERLTTDYLMRTLVPGQKGCLKSRMDGTVLDGHHRLYILRARGVDVNRLPRQIVIRTSLSET
jgi:hypothetical protein